MSSLLSPRSVVGEASELRTGRADPTVAVRRTLDRIAEVDDQVHAFVPEPGREQRLLAAAASIARQWPNPDDRPPLYGIPVGIKDIVHVTGLPTRAGSGLPIDALAGDQGTLVERLVGAGALVAGKTVTAEFAVLAPGPTGNPHNTAHTPGGSSSGSAAAVAAGMVPLAVGTQTVGSMIRPAAYCGVVGFKPTFDRIPIDGVIANAPGFDTLGVYATDVAGIALAASVVCDDWAPDLQESLRSPVLGIPVGPYLERATSEALDAFAGTVAILREAGFTVREVPMWPDFAQIQADLFIVNRYQLARTHADLFRRFAECYRDETVVAIRQGQDIDHDDYVRATRRRDEFKADLAKTMTDYGIDVWITPAATGPAPEGLQSTGSSIMCLPWSNAGLPSLSLPAGLAANGLPLGLQLVGRANADELLLRWAAAVYDVV